MLYLYFMQAGRGPIKIGLSDDPESRCDLLQVGNHEHLVVLAARPGTAALERELHQRFAEGHLRGEWFRSDTPGLREAIAHAAQIEAETVLGERGLCAHCGVRAILPPRTRVCSAECERERKRARSAAWRVDRGQQGTHVTFRIPSEEEA